MIVEIVGVVWARGALGIDAGHGGAPQPADYSNTLELGSVLYTRYAYPLELAAMLLLVAIVAAIALTMRAPRRATSSRTSPPRWRCAPPTGCASCKMDAEKRP